MSSRTHVPFAVPQKQAPETTFFCNACGVVFALALAAALSAKARAEPLVHPHVTLHADAAVPLGTLANRTAALGGIIGCGALVSLGRVPIYLGADVSGLLMLSDSSERAVPGYPRLTLETTTQPRAFLGYLLLRVQSPWGRVRPYVEGRVGLKHFRTRTTVDLEGNLDQVELDSYSRPSGTALSGGVGFGIEFVDFAGQAGEAEGAAASGGLSLSVHWLPGASVTFSEADVVGPDPQAGPKHVQLRTRTDMLTISLALRAQLL